MRAIYVLLAFCLMSVSLAAASAGSDAGFDEQKSMSAADEASAVVARHLLQSVSDTETADDTNNDDQENKRRCFDFPYPRYGKDCDCTKTGWECDFCRDDEPYPKDGKDCECTKYGWECDFCRDDPYPEDGKDCKCTKDGWDCEEDFCRNEPYPKNGKDCDCTKRGWQCNYCFDRSYPKFGKDCKCTAKGWKCYVYTNCKPKRCRLRCGKNKKCHCTKKGWQCLRKPYPRT